MRSMAEINRAREAAEAKKTAIAAEQRAMTERLHAEARTADDGEQERLARLERGYQKASAEYDSLTDEYKGAILEFARDHPEACEYPVGDPRNQRGDTRSSRTADDGLPPQLRAVRDQGLRAIDRSERAGELAADAAARAERLLSTGTATEQSVAARWAATTGDPAYARAFQRLLTDPTRGHLLWTPQEAEAYRRVEETRAYMSLTDNVGGFMVPLNLDPAIILSSAGTNNIMRKVATVKQTVSESWQGVTSAGVTAEWIAENTQVAEATPTLAAVPIPVYKGDAFTPFSFEVGMDAVGFQQELAKVLVDAADTLMATAYTTGPGTTAPTGIVTALLGTASEINGLGSEALAVTDPYALQNALPGRFSANAAFMSHIAIANGYAVMETANGARQFPELREGRLLNKPWLENPHMDGALNAAATENNYVLIYGDFSQYFIVDRIGTTLEIIPNLMGANYRPTGSRGALLWFRTGGNVSTINAFRMLDVPTTA